ncbi:MAG: hypothetical protein U9Q83_11410 [Bacteroidota bacterium]|nr:hypothetical protein [Bacteroidota bacterium]
MKMIAINKYSSILKIWSVEMPNASYSKRCAQYNFSKKTRINTFMMR